MERIIIADHYVYGWAQERVREEDEKERAKA
jgi:hypothetical protein